MIRRRPRQPTQEPPAARSRSSGLRQAEQIGAVLMRFQVPLRADRGHEKRFVWPELATAAMAGVVRGQGTSDPRQPCQLGSKNRGDGRQDRDFRPHDGCASLPIDQLGCGAASPVRFRTPGRRQAPRRLRSMEASRRKPLPFHRHPTGNGEDPRFAGPPRTGCGIRLDGPIRTADTTEDQTPSDAN
jgi:hypothetical protein